MFKASGLHNWFGLFAVGLLFNSMLVGCQNSGDSNGGSSDAETFQFAFITNGPASFWDVAEKGALKAEEELGVKVDVYMPTDDAAGQKRIIDDLLVREIDGIAISPIDPANQSELLNSAGDQTILITHDSDAPETNRLCYIGMDNYDAGRRCGQLVKEAIPEGGNVVLFIGRLDQLNAQLRRQGVIDELLDREPDSSRYDKPGSVIAGEKYQILDTRVDGFDFAKAKADAADAISRYADLDCMVGLFAYNPPLCLEAIRDAGKLGEIKIVAFDEADESLQGIVDGHIYGTVVQNPYMYGYESIRVLNALKQGDQSVIPENKTIYFDARKITKSNVQEFWDELKELTK